MLSVIGEICLIFTVRLGFMQDPRNQPVDRLVLLSFPHYPPFLSGTSRIIMAVSPQALHWCEERCVPQWSKFVFLTQVHMKCHSQPISLLKSPVHVGETGSSVRLGLFNPLECHRIEQVGIICQNKGIEVN